MTRLLILCSVSTPEQAKDDKVSMEQQEADALAFAESRNWDVVDTIRIPGYSRSFYTLAELVDAANRDGEYGPAKLQSHIHDHDFDVMWARSTNRFGREQSINAEVIGKIVRECGAVIYSQRDGFIDAKNYRAYIAITGFRDASEVDELVQKRAIGIDNRARRGMPISGNPPLSHRLVRDPVTGKGVRLEVREELRPLWRDVAALLFENVSYEQLELELYSRWGYRTESGLPYRHLRIYRTLMNPVFWGNNVIRRQNKGSRYIYGIWAFDPAIPAPPQVDLFWNTHDAVYAGDLAADVQAELRRRTELHNGSESRGGTRRFSGLVICADCDFRFVYHATRATSGKLHYYLRCNNRRRLLPPEFGGRNCENLAYIKEATAQRWMHNRLEEWIASGAVTYQPRPATDDSARQIAALKEARSRLDKRYNGLMMELADADEDMRADFRRQARATKDELIRVGEQLAGFEAQALREHRQSQSQVSVLREIREMGLPAFWGQDDLMINRMLKRLLDTVKLVAKDGEVVGFYDSDDGHGI